MEADAEAYDELSQPQIKIACTFISTINLSKGAKVLDMGCGTGNVTKYIADIVGSDGQVVGVDPDDERIKIATEKYKEVGHLEFHVGNSVTGFPHDNEPYYDVLISVNAFHWFPNDQKLFIQKAYQSLKPGGMLAISCGDKPSKDLDEYFESLGVYQLTKQEMQKLFQDLGLFVDVEVKQIDTTSECKSKEVFQRWMKASSHYDMKDVNPAFVKQILGKFTTFHEDGRVTLKLPGLYITASK